MRCTRASGATSDHPRACGANGLHRASQLRVQIRRIIPAHAGQTPSRRPSTGPAPDHPRACGANASECSDPDCVGGSSPRMRGKPPYGHAPLEHARIIPAHAGQTRSRSPHSSPYPDHPRACGANVTVDGGGQPVAGSSPRMRGKLTANAVIRLTMRIIPAHAGQTWRADASTTACPDHPRACGANMTGTAMLLPNAGSSPRMRGKQLCLLAPW